MRCKGTKNISFCKCIEQIIFLCCDHFHVGDAGCLLISEKKGSKPSIFFHFLMRRDEGEGSGKEGVACKIICGEETDKLTKNLCLKPQIMHSRSFFIQKVSESHGKFVIL